LRSPCSCANSGTGVPGAAVSVRITDPAFAVTTLTPITDSTGKATVSYALRSRNAKKDTYSVSSTATMGTVSKTATTSFAVN
jgi:hypothetical protein